jgi:hypothetical protein
VSLIRSQLDKFDSQHIYRKRIGWKPPHLCKL